MEKLWQHPRHFQQTTATIHWPPIHCTASVSTFIIYFFLPRNSEGLSNLPNNLQTRENKTKQAPQKTTTNKTHPGEKSKSFMFLGYTSSHSPKGQNSFQSTLGAGNNLPPSLAWIPYLQRIKEAAPKGKQGFSNSWALRPSPEAWQRLGHHKM